MTGAVDKVDAGHGNVKVQLHIGGACYMSITSGIKLVDMRKFYRSYGAKSDDEINPLGREWRCASRNGRTCVLLSIPRGYSIPSPVLLTCCVASVVA